MNTIKEKTTSILVAESTDYSNGSLRQILTQMGIEVQSCADGIDTLKKIIACQPDIVLADALLPRLSGFQIVRLIKNDPLLRHIPIVLMGPAQNRNIRAWALACGAEAYVRKPRKETDVAESFARFIDMQPHNLKASGENSQLSQLDDGAILTMANNLMEQELIWLTQLTDLSVLKVSDKTRSELVAAYMELIGSSFEFGFGAVLFLEKDRGEFFFYHDDRIGETQILQAKAGLLNCLRQDYCLLLNPESIRVQQLTVAGPLIPVQTVETLQIHTNNTAQVHAMIAFEKTVKDSLDDHRKKFFDLAVNVGVNLFEKKIWQETFQECSIIDAVSDGYSAAFFIECLRREIEDAVRHNYPLTLFTIGITNWEEMTAPLTFEQGAGLIRSIQNLILTVMRKSDIVARFETAYFAFLLRHVKLEKAQIARTRIIGYIEERLSKFLPASIAPVIETGIREFAPSQDRAPEVFLARAQPL